MNASKQTKENKEMKKSKKVQAFYQDMMDAGISATFVDMYLAEAYKASATYFYGLVTIGSVINDFRNWLGNHQTMFDAHPEFPHFLAK
jgi:hypothetical protein